MKTPVLNPLLRFQSKAFDYSFSLHLNVVILDSKCEVPKVALCYPPAAASHHLIFTHTVRMFLCCTFIF